MAKEELLTLDLQLFAEDAQGEVDSSDTDTSAAERVSELEKKLLERDSALAEAEKKYGKLKSTLDSKLKELGDMTKKERERMTAEELERKEIEEIREQNAMLLKEREVVSAEKRFIQFGCDSDMANIGAKALVDSDYDGLFDVFSKIIDAKIAGEKSELLKAIPKPQGGGSSSTMTKEQFDKLNYKDLVALKEKDPETYKKFM